MRRWCALAFIFFIGFGSAVGSSTLTDFKIQGDCIFSFEGYDIALSAGECSTGESRGLFFCKDGDPFEPLETKDVGLGCSRGLDTLPSLDIGDCCSDGYICVPVGSEFQCQFNPTTCSASMTESECAIARGYYYDNEDGEENDCICERYDQDCSIYINEADCVADVMNIGEDGFGSDICKLLGVKCGSKTFTADGCGCEWDNVVGGCYRHMNVTENFYSGIPDKFECSNYYTLGSCISGSQSVSWISDKNVISGFGGDEDNIPVECLEAFDCNGGEVTRFCGEPVVKLPGFSLFSLISSLFIIGIYYFIIGSRRGFVSL
jgi:hypothetical protein